MRSGGGKPICIVVGVAKCALSLVNHPIAVVVALIATLRRSGVNEPIRVVAVPCLRDEATWHCACLLRFARGTEAVSVGITKEHAALARRTRSDASSNSDGVDGRFA